MNLPPTIEEFTALQQALAAAKRRSELLNGELVLVRTERDLLKERLNKFMRKIFAAKSEVSSQSQKDMFFNEAEVLGVHAQAAIQEEIGSDDDGKDGTTHKRGAVVAGAATSHNQSACKNCIKALGGRYRAVLTSQQGSEVGVAPFTDSQ